MDILRLQYPRCINLESSFNCQILKKKNSPPDAVPQAIFDDLPQNLKDKVLNTTGISTRSLFNMAERSSLPGILAQNDPEGELKGSASNGEPSMRWVKNKPCN